MSSAEHFGHRESDGVVVDLFWNDGLLDDEFRVEVVDGRQGRVVLYARTWGEAIDAYYDPFSVTTRPRDLKRKETRP